MDELGLDDEKKIILGKFRKNVQDVLQPKHNDRFLLRWLRARNYNLVDAEKMFRADLKFRKKIGSDTILDTYELKKELQPYQCTAFLGFDINGHPVRLFNFAAVDFKGMVRCLPRMDIIKYLVSILESDSERLRENNMKNGTHVETGIIIVNYEGLKLRDFADKRVIEIGIHVLQFYQDHYPETLHSVYLVNTPTLFYTIFNLFKPFLNEVVLEKIRIYGHDNWKEEIFSTIPPEIIPAFMGGKRYGPGEDYLCRDLVSWEPKIPPSLYLTDFCSLKTDKPGVCEKVIQPGSVFETEVKVTMPGSLLCWEFQTKRHEIRYGLFFKKIQVTEKICREELIPVEATDASEFIENGEFLCSKIGTYILQFDNTQSWFTAKHLLYKTEVKPPTEITLTTQELTC